MTVSLAERAEPIEMPFEVWTRVMGRKECLVRTSGVGRSTWERAVRPDATISYTRHRDMCLPDDSITDQHVSFKRLVVIDNATAFDEDR